MPSSRTSTAPGTSPASWTSRTISRCSPVGLSIFSFRYAPAGFSGDLDALNERVLIELQKAGSSYLSNGRIRGKFALRGCVLNYRTTKEDMRVLLRDLREAARMAHAASGTIK